MKKTLYIIFSLLVVLACNKENIEPAGNGQSDYKGEKTTISAEICDGYNLNESKTYLIDSDSDRYIRWMSGDMLGIYGDKSTQNTVAELNEDSEGQTKGIFLVGGPLHPRNLHIIPILRKPRILTEPWTVWEFLQFRTTLQARRSAEQAA